METPFALIATNRMAMVNEEVYPECPQMKSVR
jgi:hypothetical protein